VPEGGRALCARCGGLLRRRQRNSVERKLAFTIAASVLFAVANVFPFLSFDMKGRVTQTTLATGVFDLWEQGVPEIAALVALTALIVQLDFHEGVPPAEMVWTENPPVFPTIPAPLEEITASVQHLVKRLETLPLDEVVKSVNGTLGAATSALEQARRTLAAADQIEQ
jgi:hypothetical protein